SPAGKLFRRRAREVHAEADALGAAYVGEFLREMVTLHELLQIRTQPTKLLVAGSGEAREGRTSWCLPRPNSRTRSSTARSFGKNHFYVELFWRILEVWVVHL